MESLIVTLCIILCLALLLETTFLVITGERMTKKIIKKFK